MKVQFTVHKVRESTVSRIVEVGGKKLSASVPSVIVEIVDDTNQSYSRHFIGDEATEAKLTFKEGATITAVIS